MSALSRLDERFGTADDLEYVSADNAVLVLARNGVQREFIDFMSSYGATNFGHRNPAIEQCLAGGSDTIGVCYPAEARAVAAWLCARVGLGDAGRVLFQVGGSFAVSTALAMAMRRRPGKVVTIQGGFHGLGADALAATSIQHGAALQRTDMSKVLDSQVMTLEYGRMPQTWDDVSCLLFEPIQGANGYVPLERGWLRSLVAAAKAAGVVVIADEIQAGFYRHGSLSPSHSAGLDPDVYLFSKSLTNGMFPLSAVVYRRDIEPIEQQPFLAHTFQTAVLGYRAADAVTKYLDTAAVDDAVLSVESELNAVAARMQARDFADAVHVCGPSLSFRPRAVNARTLAAGALERGLLVFVGGAEFDRIRVAPPITIPIPQLRAGLAILFELTAEFAGDESFVAATRG